MLRLTHLLSVASVLLLCTLLPSASPSSLLPSPLAVSAVDLSHRRHHHHHQSQSQSDSPASASSASSAYSSPSSPTSPGAHDLPNHKTEHASEYKGNSQIKQNQVPENYVRPLIDNAGGAPDKGKVISSFHHLLTKQPDVAVPTIGNPARDAIFPDTPELDASLYDNDIDTPSDPATLANKKIVPIQNELKQLKQVLQQGKLLASTLPSKQQRLQLLESKLAAFDKDAARKKATEQMEKQKKLLNEIKSKGNELEKKLSDLKKTETTLIESVNKAKAAISAAPRFSEREIRSALDGALIESGSERAESEVANEAGSESESETESESESGAETETEGTEQADSSSESSDSLQDDDPDEDPEPKADPESSGGDDGGEGEGGNASEE